jgi:hypothetical protein
MLTLDDGDSRGQWQGHHIGKRAGNTDRSIGKLVGRVVGGIHIINDRAAAAAARGSEIKRNEDNNGVGQKTGIRRKDRAHCNALFVLGIRAYVCVAHEACPGRPGQKEPRAKKEQKQKMSRRWFNAHAYIIP